MRYLKLKKFTTYLAGLLILSACASDNLSDPPVVSHKNTPFYLTFELSQPSDASTRADEDKEGNEAKLTSLVALLVDTDNVGQPTVIQGIGAAVQADIGEPKDGKYTVTLNMGVASLYTRQHKYRLFVFANLNDYSALLASHGKRLDDIGSLTASTEIYSAAQLAAADFKGLPFSTNKFDASVIQVYLKENTDYSSSSPYIVQEDSGKENPETEGAGVLWITPLHACMNFVEETGVDDFIYTVGTDAKPEVKVQIKNATFVNAAKKTFLLPQGEKGNFSLTSPSSPGFSNSTSVAINGGKIFYAPEYIPSVSEEGRLGYDAASYMELQAILIVDASCTGTDPDVRKAISEANTNAASRPSLFYFDDGTFQSALTTVSHADEENWHEVKWNDTLGGYAVTYRHAIRHDAGDGMNLDDGTIHPMEYAVVRNYLYNIGIKSVSSLPHKFNSSDPVENSRQEISIQISPAKWTGYHRGAIEIDY